MSRRVNHAIIVSTSIPDHIKEPYYRAQEIFGPTGVSSISTARYNAVTTFYVPPDGSSEGWPESDLGNSRRDKFIAFLKALKAKEIWVQWVEVQWGDDYRELPDAVTRSSCSGETDGSIREDVHEV